MFILDVIYNTWVFISRAYGCIKLTNLYIKEYLLTTIIILFDVMTTDKQLENKSGRLHLVCAFVMARLSTSIYQIHNLVKYLLSVRYAYSYKLNIRHILKDLPQKQRKIYCLRPLLKNLFIKNFKKNEFNSTTSFK